MVYNVYQPKINKIAIVLLVVYCYNTPPVSLKRGPRSFLVQISLECRKIDEIWAKISLKIIILN